METLNKYVIELKNISPATDCRFDYLLENDFFDEIGGGEIRKGKVKVSVSVMRFPASFEMQFHLEGVVSVVCDRCLEDVDIPIKSDNKLTVTFGETYAEINEEQIEVPEDDGTVNVAWYMYECIVLAMPMKHVHEAGGCNEEMAAKLKEHSVDKVDGDLTEDSGIIDPRWDALRKLMIDN